MLRVYLLGRLRFKSDHDSLSDLSLRRKTRALLAYLCLADNPLSREHLTNLLCRNSNDPQGALRWHISRIRRSFHVDILNNHENAVSVDQAKVWVDALQFTDKLNGSVRLSSTAELEGALRLYEGELLAGIHLPKETDYELWLLGQRAHYAQLFEKGASELIQRLIEAADYDAALEWAKRLLSHNSILEDAHYWLMWLYARTGQAQVASQQYEVYQELMLREFSAEVGDRLTELHQQILRNELPSLNVSVPPTEVNAPGSLSTPFVGRTVELALLNRRRADASNGIGRAVVIHGDAGMGKSALVRQFAAQLPRDVALFSGTCYESTLSAALSPWIQVIRDILRSATAVPMMPIPDIFRTRLGWLVPDLMPLTPAERDTTHKGDLNTQLLLNTIVDFFSLLASHRALVIWLEDFHFADEYSVQLLSLLLRRLSSTPVLVVVTLRTVELQENARLELAFEEWQSIEQLDPIALEPLDRRYVEKLMDTMIPEVQDKAAFYDRLMQHTLGISLHIMDVLHSCQNQPQLLDNLPVPLSFATLIGQRLKKMSESQRQLLETLAILDYPTSLSEILECTGQNDHETIQNLDRLINHRFVALTTENGQITYNLRHYLYSELIVSAMSGARKQLLHRRVAQFFGRLAAVLPESQRTDVVTRVVYHARHAGDVDALIRWVPIAAERAASAFAYREALEYYQSLDTVLQQTPRLPPQDYAGVLLKMVELLRLLGDWQAQARLLQRIDEWDKAGAISQRDLRLRFLVEYGANLFRSGDYAQALPPLMEAIAQRKVTGNTLLIAQAYNTLGNIAHFQSEWDTAEEHYQQAIILREALGDDVGVGKGYNNLGAIAYHRGDYQRAAEFYRKNLLIREAHQDKHGIATSLNNLGTVFMTLGQWDDATDHYERALEIRRQLDDRHGIASTLENLGQIHVLQERLTEATPYYQESLSIREAINDTNGVARSLGALGEVYNLMWEWELAIRYLQQALDIYQSLGNKLEMAESMASLSYARAMQVCAYPDDLLFEALQIGYDLDSNQLMCSVIESLARILIRMKDGVRAARYVGLVTTHKLDQRRDFVQDILPSLRLTMDEDTLATEIERGTQMSLTQVVNDLLANRTP